MDALKQKLLNECISFTHKREVTLEKAINTIQESLLSETKSTAGDKHETGRAMLQLEREKIGRQLQMVQKLKSILNKINISTPGEKIKLGSLVFTSQNNYFIAISVGKITIDQQDFFTIAPDTPIGKLLLGKSKGASISFNKESITIMKVL